MIYVNALELTLLPIVYFSFIDKNYYLLAGYSYEEFPLNDKYSISEYVYKLVIQIGILKLFLIWRSFSI